jgi:Co/Zn/Cd efflux system component
MISPQSTRRVRSCDGDSLITDLHIWRIASDKFAAIVSIVAHNPKPSDAYRALFREHEELAHVTVEVQHCHDRELVSC